MNDNLTCGLVRDLLPSYLEGLTAEETNEAVERHLASCPRCAAALEELREGAREEARAEPREVEYLKKVRRSGKKRVLLAVLATMAALLAVFLLKIFVIGTPLQAQTVAVTEAQVDHERLHLRLISVSSGNAYHGWKVETVDGVASIYARSVLVSGLFHSGEGEVYVPLEGVREVWLGGRSGRLVWQDGMVISQRAADLMDLKTPYCGDASALGRLADAMGLNAQSWSYTTELQTSRYPYRWTIRFQHHWGDNSADRLMGEYYGPLMLALVDNLDEVGWRYTTATSSGKTLCQGVLTREEADARVIELTESYNLLHGTRWAVLDDIRDYTRTPADLQRLLLLLEAGM